MQCTLYQDLDQNVSTIFFLQEQLIVDWTKYIVRVTLFYGVSKIDPSVAFFFFWLYDISELRDRFQKIRHHGSTKHFRRLKENSVFVLVFISIHFSPFPLLCAKTSCQNITLQKQSSSRPPRILNVNNIIEMWQGSCLFRLYNPLLICLPQFVHDVCRASTGERRGIIRVKTSLRFTQQYLRDYDSYSMSYSC